MTPQSVSPTDPDPVTHPIPQADMPASQRSVSARKRSKGLTIYLVLTIVVNLMIAVLTWVSLSDVPSDYQALIFLAGLINIVSIGLVIGIYFWKKWAVYGYVAGIALISLINLATGDLMQAARGVIPIGLMLALVHPVWQDME